VAQVLQTNPNATELLLNALVSLSLLEKSGERFSLTDNARTYLLKASAQYLGGMILFDSSLWDTWGKLEETVKSGKPARPPDMFQGSAAETEHFIMAMHSLVTARGDGEIVCQFLDMSEAARLLDVGGGPGTYAIHFCRTFPKLRVTIFDLPGTLQVTTKLLAPIGFLENRIDLVPGDYTRDELPKGFDLVFLSNIIHGETPKTNLALMRKVFDSLNPNGRIVIKDHIMDSSLTRPKAGAVFSLQMLLTTNGRDYSFDEVSDWLAQVGFINVQEVPLALPLTSSLVMGRKEKA
jgi:SAM-dependent methyltransferase